MIYPVDLKFLVHLDPFEVKNFSLAGSLPWPYLDHPCAMFYLHTADVTASVRLDLIERLTLNEGSAGAEFVGTWEHTFVSVTVNTGVRWNNIIGSCSISNLSRFSTEGPRDVILRFTSQTAVDTYVSLVLSGLFDYALLQDHRFLQASVVSVP